MTIGAIEYSSFANPPSDVAKVSGQGFQQTHQHQLAEMMRQEMNLTQDKTAGIEHSTDSKRISDSESGNDDQQKRKREDQLIHSTENAAVSENNATEYVSYDDPDVGHQFDWEI